MISDTELVTFIEKSNAIERIYRPASIAEITGTVAFLAADSLTIEDVTILADLYEPGAKLRNKPGMNVRVGHALPVWI